MPFCRYCGRPLRDDGRCDCAASASEQPWGSPPIYAPAYESPQSRAKSLMREAFGLIRGLFSARPGDAVFAAGRSDAKVWPIYLGIAFLLALLSSAALSISLAPIFAVKTGITFGGLLSAFLVYTAAQCFASGLLLMLICDWTGHRTGFHRMMNLAALCLLPQVGGIFITLAGGTVLPFVSGFASSAGTIASYILMYVGLKRQTTFAKDPVWLFILGLVIINFILSVILVLYLLPVIVNLILPSIREYLPNMNLKL